jgi:TonB family protein
MGYLALLFCPDEKTARTVTQVLGELEFSVESCMEPFAAVKKLMGQHFDAVVVDCDNEQNATLLFKSARNSTSNQASLAVAVVEGQAGVAKAFRIGANLVLTKPINIEQAKGTLRVARGLLRKGDPVKPAAPSPTVAPPKPVAAKPVPPLRPAPPTTLAAAMAPRPVAPPEVKPVPAQTRPAAAVASSVPAANDNDNDLLDIGSGVPVPAPSAEKIVDAAFSKAVISDSHAVTPAASSSSVVAELKSSSNAGLPATHSSGAASAPAPAREIQNSQTVETPSASTPAEVVAPAEQPVEAASSASSNYAGSAPSFTFGGANAPEESSGGNKKVLIGVAAAVLVAGALYFGWTQFQGRSSQPVSSASQTSPAPVPAPQIPKPSAKADSVVPSASPSASLPSSLPEAATAKNQPAVDTATTSDDGFSGTNSTKSSSSVSPSASKPAAAPLVLKGGTAPVLQAKAAAPDAPAPSMIGIATAGAGAPPPDLGSTPASAPTPVLQTLNVSQGVSQGLLTKKIQPIYPRNALAMHLEGTVELQATISKSGDISRVKVLSGDGQLAKAATDAVKQWKYKPYLLNGEPVEIQTQVTINFKLPR